MLLVIGIFRVSYVIRVCLSCLTTYLEFLEVTYDIIRNLSEKNVLELVVNSTIPVGSLNPSLHLRPMIHGRGSVTRLVRQSQFSSTSHSLHYGLGLNGFSAAGPRPTTSICGPWFTRRKETASSRADTGYLIDWGQLQIRSRRPGLKINILMSMGLLKWSWTARIRNVFYYPPEVSSMKYCQLGVFRKKCFRLIAE